MSVSPLAGLMRAEEAPTAQPWSAPQLDGVAAPGRRPRTVREMQAAEEAVWQAVRDEARAQGLAAAKAEIDARIAKLDAQAARLSAVLEMQAKPLARLDAEVEQQLAELAIAIARQLLRRELKIDPSQVIGVVRDTVALLPAAARDVRVIVHPEDAALIRERLVAAHTEAPQLGVFGPPRVHVLSLNLALDALGAPAMLHTRSRQPERAADQHPRG